MLAVLVPGVGDAVEEYNLDEDGQKLDDHSQLKLASTLQCTGELREIQMICV